MSQIKSKIQSIKLEDILCVVIILCPILDMLSFIFRNTFDTNISPSTFIRPIIPITIFIIVFFKNKIKKQMLAASLLYATYAVIHLIIYNNIKSGCSYGGVLAEAQYLVNYTFAIMNLFIFVYLFWKKDCEKLTKSMLIAFGIYMVSLYIVILTGTSSTTYIEGIGYKGWYESGNSLCVILCVSLCAILPMLKNKKMRPYVVALTILSGVFLTTLVGTRTGLLGFILIIGLYIASECFVALIKRVQIDKKMIGFSIFAVVLIISLTIIGGSKTFERREHLEEIQASATDIETGEIRHLSGDITALKTQIEAGELSEEYMPREMQTSILRLADYAERTNLENNDMRMQQLVYNFYLVQEQKSILLTLFGNGYKTQFRELVMEMEIPAYLFNFGVCGFVLYFIPFFAIAVYGAYVAIRKIKQIDTQYIMYLGGSWLAIFLSLLSGYTFFNSSSMIITFCP